MLNQVIISVGKQAGKSLLKGTGKVVTGVLIFGIGSAVATALRPIADREGRKLYRYIYDEEVPTPQRRTTAPKR